MKLKGPARQTICHGLAQVGYWILILLVLSKSQFQLLLDVVLFLVVS